jgi:hypothetical protein
MRSKLFEVGVHTDGAFMGMLGRLGEAGEAGEAGVCWTDAL